MTWQLHECLLRTAERNGTAPAIKHRQQTLSYETLASETINIAQALLALGLARADRIAVYSEKRSEAVIGMYAAAAAGGVFVPVNPALKAPQVAYILRDCNVRILITTPSRFASLKSELASCSDLRQVIVLGDVTPEPTLSGIEQISWSKLPTGGTRSPHRNIDSDMAAILYTSGSTGKPKGVVLSHRNMVTGAVSVSTYL